MSVEPIRRALRALLSGSAAAARPLVIQPVGFEPEQLDTLPAVLDEVSRSLGQPIRLNDKGGDLVLAAEEYMAAVGPQALSALLEERPVVTLSAGRPIAADSLPLLTEQIKALSRSGGAADLSTAEMQPTSSGFDSEFDSGLHAHRLVESELDPDRAELLNRLRRGLIDPSQPALLAGYGQQATMEIDFATGIACIDEQADQRLRASREVPFLWRGAGPGFEAKQRELDRLVWDIAVAAGGYRLLYSPVGWWHAGLVAHASFGVSRYTRLPQHLEMARLLRSETLSPAQLRRRARVGLTDLRGFLQACLFLGLVYWVPAATR